MVLRLLSAHSSGDYPVTAVAIQGDGGADIAEDVPLHWASLAAIGAVAGWSSGFLGIGGGLAITALMTGLMKISQHRAQAMSLAVTALPVTRCSTCSRAQSCRGSQSSA